MITKEYRRTKAIGPDLVLGRKGEILVYNLLINTLDLNRFEIIDLNESNETFKCGDILVYDKIEDFIYLYEVEAKRDFHFQGVLKGNEIFLSDDEWKPITIYTDLSISNKSFNLLSNYEFNIEGLFNKRKLTDEELDKCTFIMVNGDDINLIPQQYIKVNIAKSVSKYYDNNAKYGNRRIRYRHTSRGDDKLIHIPFKECEFVNDNTN